MRKRFALLGVGVLLAISGWWISSKSEISISESSVSNHDLPPGDSRVHGETDGQGTRTKTDRSNRAFSSPRARELASEMAKWVDYLAKRDNGDGAELPLTEVMALAQESAEALLTSVEAVRLLEFMEDSGLSMEAGYVRRRLIALFDTEKAGEMRQLLASAVNLSFLYGVDNTQDDLMTWCYEAGKTPDKEQMDIFLAAMDIPTCQQSAQLGYYKELANDDPMGAYKGVLAILQSGTDSLMKNEALKGVVSSFPQGIKLDYQAMESALPPDTSEVSNPYDEARTEIMVRWAEVDPAGAANYIMNNPDRINPRRVKTIVSIVIHSEADGIEWARNFSEGIYFDYAASAVVNRLARISPDVASEWANRIKDREIRQRELDHIQYIQKGLHRIEGDGNH